MINVRLGIGAGIVACLVYGSAASVAQQSQQSRNSFRDQAIEMNTAEVQIGHIAADKAQNSQVKNYAMMMIKDHTDALAKLQGNATGTTNAPGNNREKPSAATDAAGTTKLS